MTVESIKYSEGYKYRTEEDSCHSTKIYPPQKIVTEYITLNDDGTLYIKCGYCFDGCSGVTWDTATNMRGSAKHDAFFQLMRLGLLSRTIFYSQVNKDFYETLLADNMLKFRAWYYYKMVDKFAYKFTYPSKEGQVFQAP